MTLFSNSSAPFVGCGTLTAPTMWLKAASVDGGVNSYAARAFSDEVPLNKFAGSNAFRSRASGIVAELDVERAVDGGIEEALA